ncbi:MAG: NAD-dependent dehydratase [Actinomycetota bacterium]|nr:NAD-dependent dehydratase [Actinomycetota bacterium]
MANPLRALVVGGTGPTGPAVVNGLLQRGYAVTILHTGRHEVDSIPPEVEHLHTNPFKIDEVAATIGARTFDVVYAMYGRLRDLAPYFVGRTGQFVAVGGVPAYHGFARPHQNVPAGMLVPTRESSRRAGAYGAPDADENDKVAKIVATEDVVFEHHPTASLFRYPLIYGPGQINPREWLIVRRILDGRRRIIVADGGLTLRTAAFGANAGHALSLCVDRPDACAGKVYNISDAHVLTAAQTIEVIAASLDTELEIVGLPAHLATPARPFLGHEHTWHQFTGVDRLIHDLGYVDTLPAVDALAFTARYLAANPIERGSTTEMRLQDPFDYAAEDTLIDAFVDGTARAATLAGAYDPDFRDRYAPGSDDWRLVPSRS